MRLDSAKRIPPASMRVEKSLRCYLCALSGYLFAMNLGMASDLRMWQFEATVVSLDDPQNLFGDVRLGDTIYGEFAYDMSLAPSSDAEGVAFYDYPIGFAGIRLVMENPRNGKNLRYEPSPTDSYVVSVLTDKSHREESAVDFWQEAPPPLPGLSQLIFMDFSGLNVLSSTALPTQYNLNDWPFAAVYLGAATPLDGIVGQIYSIMPVLAGDFDEDGDVDGNDFLRWQRGESPVALSATDLSRWQGNYGAGTPFSASSRAVPEPSIWRR